MSFNAHAEMWQLIHPEYVTGSGWYCTYRLQGSSYETTIKNLMHCQSHYL